MVGKYVSHAPAGVARFGSPQLAGITLAWHTAPTAIGRTPLSTVLPGYVRFAAAANLTYPGSTVLNGVLPIAVGAVCQASANPANWGDPNRAIPAGACETYFPTIHVLGDLRVTTGSGQGVLLVDGDFTVAGNFTFTGVVIARGGLKM